MARKVMLPTYILRLLRLRNSGCDRFYDDSDVQTAMEICGEVEIPVRYRRKLIRAFFEVGMHSNLTIECAEAIKELDGREQVLKLIKRYAVPELSSEGNKSMAADCLETMELFTRSPKGSNRKGSRNG